MNLQFLVYHNASNLYSISLSNDLLISPLQVCIFAYGQTGSGKTYTMMRWPGEPREKGMVPLSLEQIFHTTQALQPQGWRYEIQVRIILFALKCYSCICVSHIL